MSYTEQYSDNKIPPGPVIRRLQVRTGDGAWTKTFDVALVDTGASRSVLPEDTLNELRAAGAVAEVESVYLRGLTGDEEDLTAVRLCFQIPGFAASESEVYFVAYADYVIVGRDILNHLRVVLAGVPSGSVQLPTLTLEPA